MKMGAFEKRFVNSPRHSARVTRRAEQLVRTANPRPGQRLLDVGCGNGAAAIHLARALGLSVTGVDVDPEQIEAAIATDRHHSEARFLTANATALPLADGEYELVFTSKTTHHIPDWRLALEEMARVLKPEGHLIYSDFVAPLGHRLPTRRSISRIADEHGLHRVHHTSSPFHYAAVFRAPKEPVILTP
jgi:ubiquinone/menaquinone biosynthesis C-methylase UbiE